MGGPDLTAMWGSIRIRPGITINASLTVKNIGTAEAASTVVRVYVSTDPVLDAGDYPIGYQRLAPIKSGKSRLYRLSYTSPPGVDWSGRYLIAFVDSDLQIDEMSEQNNIVVSIPFP